MIEKLTEAGRVHLISELVEAVTNKDEEQVGAHILTVGATIFNDLGRIADALEAIAINTTPVRPANIK